MLERLFYPWERHDIALLCWKCR